MSITHVQCYGTELRGKKANFLKYQFVVRNSANRHLLEAIGVSFFFFNNYFVKKNTLIIKRDTWGEL